MVKIRTYDIFITDNDKLIFGDDFDSELFWDNPDQELRLTTTISGVDPTQSYHLTTKYYVDQGDIDNFLELTDTPVTYSGYADYIVTVNPTETGLIFDDISNALSGTISHSSLLDLDADDHLQYVPRDGSRGFTSTVSGVYPTEDYHLTTKEYVDFSVATLSGLFGGYNKYAQSVAESSTNSTAYIEKVNLTTVDVPEGVYRIGWTWEWRHSKSNTNFLARVQIDDTTNVYVFSSSPIVDVNTWRLVTGFSHQTLTSGVHTIDIDYASSSAGSTSYIRNVEIEFWRAE